MGKRKKPEEIKRLLADAERDLSRGLSVADICRKMGGLPPLFNDCRKSRGACSVVVFEVSTICLLVPVRRLQSRKAISGGAFTSRSKGSLHWKLTSGQMSNRRPGNS